ncbi:MAG: cysB [Halothiobacillaceae bacterium]|nr:MAG: cysB [Halothiobacillaceae bacterium]
MKLQQLRFVCEVARHGLSISAAADALYTAQPGVSNQIRLLEEELQVAIFVRHGNDNIKRVSGEYAHEVTGRLTIATTHTQARYALPPVIKRFTTLYPTITLHIAQGSPTQIAEQVVSGKADLAIATEGLQLYDDLVMMACYDWNHCVIAPPDHPILGETPLSLQRPLPLSHLRLCLYRSH